MKLKIIYDFFRLWIKWGDRKESWQDSKLINDIKFKEDMKNFDVEIKLNKMNGEEINIFLESIGGLENGYYPDRERITKSTFFDIEEGWYPLVKELIEDLIELGWDKQICQVKEKFGGLRFYINGGSDEIFKRIVKAENDSYNICEVTGTEGKLRTDIGWYRTLCDEEYEKIKNKKDGI